MCGRHLDCKGFPVQLRRFVFHGVQSCVRPPRCGVVSATGHDAVRRRGPDHPHGLRPVGLRPDDGIGLSSSAYPDYARLRITPSHPRNTTKRRSRITGLDANSSLASQLARRERRRSMVGDVLATAHDQCPDRARHLVGERDRGDVELFLVPAAAAASDRPSPDCVSPIPDVIWRRDRACGASIRCPAC